MQNIDIAKLIQVKLDFSVVQDALSSTIADIYSKISKLQNCNEKNQQKTSELDKQTQKIYEQLQKIRQAHGNAFQLMQEKLSGIPSIVVHQTEVKNQKPFEIIQKTPRQVLDHIEYRLQLNPPNHQNPQRTKQVDLICSPPNTDRVMQTFRVKQTLVGQHHDHKDLIDQKVYSFYEKVVQRIEAQITELRRDFRTQINQFTDKSMKLIDGKLGSSQNNEIKKIKQQNISTLHKIELQNQPQNVPTKSHKVIIMSQKKLPRVDKSSSCVGDIQNKEEKEKQNENYESNSLNKSEISQLIAELKKEVKEQLQQLVKNAEQKCEQISRTNSVIADHLVEAKKSMQELTNQKDTLKLQMDSIRQKSSSSERQVCLLIDTMTEHKNKFKSLQNNIVRLSEDVKDLKISPDMIKQQNNEDDASNQSSKKQIFRDSQMSFRSSVGNNLAPIRNNSVLKMGPGKMDIIQETVRNINGRVSTLFDRVNKMQDEKKRFDLQGFGSSLPRIQKQNKSNVNPLQVIRKQLKKVNEDIVKTNQKLTLTKDRLNELYQSHLEIPNKIQDLYIKLRQYNELQEDRLIQLIKQLINRMLSDPFDNNFTNRLKRQINVKFLQIKYEYNCILKQIESKVENRAEISELNKVTQKFEQSLLQVKSIANKKCESEDLKKGMKYLQGKLKQVFNFAKNQTVALANQQRQYIGAKKQPLH